jgi:hypothetical protein
MKLQKLLSIESIPYLCICAVLIFWGSLGAANGADISCENIVSLAFTDIQFNKPVTFTSVKIIPANPFIPADPKATPPVSETPALPERCEIKGIIYPAINFILNVPTATYNERFIMIGQGGTAGSINRDAATVNGFIAKGFATVVTDTGHIDPTGKARSTDWALPANASTDQLLIDFGYRSQHEVAVLAKKIIKAHRGTDPRYSYFYGCSNAGRESMSEAQKYPTDFDGYYAGSVDQDHGEDMVGFLWAGAVNKATPIASKLCLQAQYVYAKCDGVDGLVDGSIENPKACSFDPLKDLPACANNVDAANCWTLAQRTAIKKIYDGPKTSWGQPLGPRYPVGSEACSDPTNPSTSGWSGLLGGLATGVAPQQIADLFLRTPYQAYPIPTKPDPDPSKPPIQVPVILWDSATFNFDTDSFTVFNSLAADAMRVDSPNLWGLKMNGGKMIISHGLGGDYWPYAAKYDYYYDQVVKYMGARNVNDFVRLYPEPGIAHCHASKVGCAGVDYFTPLQNWVEEGRAPEGLPASRAATFRDIAKTQQILTARTRTLCPYPQEARYLGTKLTTSDYPDPIDYAANFTCVQPEKARVDIKPDRISLTTGETSFRAFIEVPHQGDWRATSAVCEGALATKLTRHGHGYEAVFNKGDLKNITAGEKVSFTVTLFGERAGHHEGHNDDTPIAIEGSDTVKITE